MEMGLLEENEPGMRFLGFLILDKEQNILFANPRCLSSFEWEESEVLGKDVDDVLPGIPMERLLNYSSSSSIKWGGHFSGVGTFLGTISGDLQFIGEHLLLLLYADQDLTNQVEEELKEVAHDLNEPVRAISKFASVLEARSKSFKKGDRELVLHMKTEADRVTEMIRELLGNPFNSEKEELSLFDLIREARDRNQLLIEEKNASIELDGVDEPFFGVREDFVRIFQNLIRNSLEHTDIEGPVITINKRDVEGKKELIFSENGHEKRPIKQWSSSSTGMGLPIVKSLVSKQNGEIQIIKGESGGTVIHLQFPARP